MRNLNASKVNEAKWGSGPVSILPRRVVGPWKLTPEDEQWVQAGKWSHAIAAGMLLAWFIARAATGGF